MRLLRYGPEGQEKSGLLDQEGRIRDLSGHVADIAGETLLPSGLEAIAALDSESLPLVEGTPRIGPCVAGMTKFMCIGLNYSDHAAETGMDVPTEPILFMKGLSAICGPDDGIRIPRGAEKVDWEVELAVIIGKPGKYIAEEDAMKHVAGYCVSNDVSERSFQMEHLGQWTKGKSADGFGPLGPWLVTADEVTDPQDLAIWCDVNGERQQDGSTATMIFGVRSLISYLSRFMSLKTGDIIATGTPPGVGVGQVPPRFLKPGDVVELGISGLGVQRQVVSAD